MKIVVTTPTGNVGSKLASILLDRQTDVTVIARHPEKVKQLASRGAHVVAGAHDDPTVLESAVRGADALFWVTPPFYESHDPIADARRFADVGATAAKKQPDLRVVQLSSAGAFRDEGTGPIVGLHHTEDKFRATAKHFIPLRANYFMDNTLSEIPAIAADGAIYVTVKGTMKSPHVYSGDISQIAADVLLSHIEGHRVIDVVGPEAISFDRVSEVIGQFIGKPVHIRTVSAQQVKQSLLKAGFSSESADLMVEMEEAMPNIANEFRGDQKRAGDTTFPQFVREIFLPAYQQATKAVA